MRLFIAEKPELARAIAAGLGQQTGKGSGFIRVGNDVVTWCFGHMLELCPPEAYNPELKKWSMESLPLCFRPWKHQPIQKSKDQLKVILGLLKEANEVVHAGDPDSEGQLLVDEILEYTKYKGPVRRVLINDNTPALVRKALANLRDNRDFHGLYQSALARSVADQWYGFSLTRAYTIAGRASGHDGVLSVGRVQTPILGLIVRRDLAIEGHAESFFYTLSAQIDTAGRQFSARYLTPENAPVDDKGRVTDRAFLDAVAAAVRGQQAQLQVRVNDADQPPPLPYNILKLQAEASTKFGLSPVETLEITQSLREKHSLITYNRSECQYLEDAQHAAAPRVLDAVMQNIPGYSKVPVDPALKSRAFNSANVDVHHGIIPTTTVANLAGLTDDEKKIYAMVARAYVAQFMPPRKVRETTVDVAVGEHKFRASSSLELSPGWRAIYGADAAADEDEGEDEGQGGADLSTLKSGQPAVCSDARVAHQKTKPPARYTYASLLTDLTRVARYIADPDLRKIMIEKDKNKKSESGGIGTPATRSNIINTLITRGYMQEKGKQLISTQLGRQFIASLPERASVPDMTAVWHSQQQQIEAGAMQLNEFLDGIEQYLKDEVQALNQGGGVGIQASGEKCPACGEGVLRQRKGKNGVFWGCSCYPNCRATFENKRGKPDLSGKPKAAPAAEATQHLCPDCQSPLVRRVSKNGNGWYGCSGYPKCNVTLFEKDGQPDGSTKKGGKAA